MKVEKLARGLALNRISFGAGLTLAPGLYARTWIGGAARDDRTKLLARALGARDLVATLAAGRAVPLPARRFAALMAAGSAAIAAAYVRRPS